jgi:hypothetical protein
VVLRGEAMRPCSNTKLAEPEPSKKDVEIPLLDLDSPEAVQCREHLTDRLRQAGVSALR